MTPITTPKGDWLFVPVPTTISSEGNGYNKIYTGDGEYEFHSLPYGELPPVKTGIKTSEATFFCMSEDITEEQAGEMVDEGRSGKYRDYCYIPPGNVIPFDTRLESFQSLMKAHKLNEKNYAILKVNEDEKRH